MISDHHLIEIKNLATTADTWRKLCALHENKSEIVHLQSLCMQDGADIQTHLTEMDRKQEVLARLSAPIIDADFYKMMLSLLQQSYNSIIQTILAFTCKSSAKLTLELIVAHLTADAEYQEQGIDPGW